MVIKIIEEYKHLDRDVLSGARTPGGSTRHALDKEVIKETTGKDLYQVTS